MRTNMTAQLRRIAVAVSVTAIAAGVLSGCEAQWTTTVHDTVGGTRTTTDNPGCTLLNAADPTVTGDSSNYHVAEKVGLVCKSEAVDEHLESTMYTSPDGSTWTQVDHKSNSSATAGLLSQTTSADSDVDGPGWFRINVSGQVTINGTQSSVTKLVVAHIGPGWASYRYGGADHSIDTEAERAAFEARLEQSDWVEYGAMTDDDTSAFETYLADKDTATTGLDEQQQSSTDDEADKTEEPETADPPVTLAPESGAAPRVKEPGATTAIKRNRYVIQTAGRWTTIRNDVQQLYAGAGYNGWIFDAQPSHENYRYGWVYAGYSYCGWIADNNANPAGGHPNQHCSANGHIPPTHIAQLINCDHCNAGSSVHIAHGRGHNWVLGWRNIAPWGRPAKNDHVWMRVGTPVAWRYVTNDNQWVAVSNRRIPSDSNWVFLPRWALPGRAANDLCAYARGSGHPKSPKYHSNFPHVCYIGHPPS